MSDEQEIRDLIQKWLAATKEGDVQTVLDLMTDDVVFMVIGQEPFGKEAFRKAAEASRSGAAAFRMESESRIEELKILGDWAYARSRLNVTAIPSDNGRAIHRAGYTLSIFRKEPDGRWRLARDANLLKVVDGRDSA